MGSTSSTDTRETSSLTLRINEIFYSIQGEALTVGLPTVFVRLSGCPLRCHYCDTSYAFHQGNRLSIHEITDRVVSYQTRYVTVTGGEPLAQKNCLPLLVQLCDQGYHVSLETSGALALSAVDIRVIKVVDIKTPGSGEVSKNRLDILSDIHPQDQLKFVICDRNDYEWSKAMIGTHHLDDYCKILFSPVHDHLAPGMLADWILGDGLPVRLQLQIHKYLWGDVPGR